MCCEDSSESSGCPLGIQSRHQLHRMRWQSAYGATPRPHPASSCSHAEPKHCSWPFTRTAAAGDKMELMEAGQKLKVAGAQGALATLDICDWALALRRHALATPCKFLSPC
ncbi:hypothetical protein WJX73_006239 [Symbiochloris irregularis]|uniref:Uncharacterized protein n=1 Tax=Symbiochloris irregularis TaxID=706552 RepID=A0AAW1NTZ5_9CHLO